MWSSLSAYARQFLGQMDKPDVDVIEGLSPAISIDQKTTARNPRSTVGTVTEIYDYLRLLWARAGDAALPEVRPARSAARPWTRSSIKVLAPAGGHALFRCWPRSCAARKGEHDKLLDDARARAAIVPRARGRQHL